MIFHSIRWRLQAWHGLILVLVLAGFGFTAYHVARDNQFRRIDQDLDQRLSALLRPGPPDPVNLHLNPNPNRTPPLRPQPPEPPREPFLGEPPDETLSQPLGQRPRPPLDEPRRGRPGGPDGFLFRIPESVQQGGALDPSQTNTFYYALWHQDGSLLASSPGAPTNVPPPQAIAPAGLQRSRPDDSPDRLGPPEPDRSPQRNARTRGQMRELCRFLPRGQCVLVGRSVAPDLAVLHRLALWLTAAGATVLFLGLAGGWWVATRAIRPIADISATATRIAAGDLSQRIDAADTDSELGRLAAVLNSTFARLEAAFAQQARFTSDASHELRTPVSVILSQTQTALSRDRAASEYREALEACQRAARRMRSLTESLLQLARLDAAQEPLQRHPFDLSRLARDCVELVRPLAAERGIQIHCDASPLECLGDPEHISQVITNLLTNAIHFNRDQGEIRLSVAAHDSKALLRVADTGHGIPAEDIPHLFERFYRVDKSRSRAQGRSGLGLAICKAILDAHRGAIGVSSQPGAGATFTVTLPLR